ncbi:radical SAM family heme chaperone HemW [Bacillus sp. Marseille-P3661]|uniref:radical SAM family heme chaperone HemW n=1 Tax=Bacillus sp. Marseille-P3661 TaxID=1936234 RepID=UPI000C8312C8|nr:radical SAM family heme chaperone HemW [Bacillus sp. Marseille-P3661]
MVKAAYIHIPFCEHICHYCDFNKVFIKNQPVFDYIDAFELELSNTLSRFPTDTINTIFVGGGTPTSLSIDQLEKFLEIIHKYLLPLTTQAEFTFEANPGRLSQEKLQLLYDRGVNRLSFGVQVFDDNLLEKIGRTHRAKDVFHTIELAKKVGFENINVDLIYSLPGQTISSFEKTLKQAFTLGVQHFSGYSLQIEPKTVFYNLMRKGKLALPTEEEEAEMYTILLKYMEEYGFYQYEISNFSKLGYESKHNLTYWNNEEYYGLGAGAHSYVHGVRRANAGPLKQYISLIQENGFPFVEENIVTAREKMEEELFLGLRKSSGVSKQLFKEKYGQDLSSIFSKEIKEQVNKGLLIETDEFVRLSQQGKYLGNEVFQAFIQ